MSDESTCLPPADAPTGLPAADAPTRRRPGGDAPRVVHRRAARLLLVDDSDEHVLLVRGFDPALPQVRYWYTIGGGVDQGEDPRAAATREAFEEAGLRLDPGALLGPYQPETVVFGFDGATVHQHQEYYLARIAWVLPDTSGLDELEVRSTDSIRWVPLQALQSLTDTVYPSTMLELVALLRAAWPPRTRR